MNMNEKVILRQIIDQCDDSLRDVFLRRMDVAVRLTKLDDEGAAIFDEPRIDEVLRHVTYGLSPELNIRANSLWTSLMRMTRGRQYRHVITHVPELQLTHEKDLVDSDGIQDGIVVCPTEMARDVASILGMEVSPCYSIAATLEALLDGKGDYGALIVNSFYDTDWLYTLIFRQPLYINAFIPLPDGRMLVLFSKKLFSDISNSIISVAFAIKMDQQGHLSQTLATLAEAQMNLEYFRVKTQDIDDDDQQKINIVFAEFTGSLTSVASRTAFLQLERELPFFRVIGYRASY